MEKTNYEKPEVKLVSIRNDRAVDMKRDNRQNKALLKKMN